MPIIYYLSHPDVAINPDIPVQDWGLSDKGRTRAIAASNAGWTSGVCRIVASAERKAVETAEVIAAARGLPVDIRPRMHENDRSSTGFLPPAEFERVADAFFAAPQVSVRGWERAIDAQTRIVDEMTAVLAGPVAGDVLIVGHGAVGTLLMTHLLGRDISREFDQPAGGGNVFAFDAVSRALSHRWRRLEDMGADA